MSINRRSKNITEGVARARNVTVDRTVDGVTVLSAGLKGGETIVVEGQQLLADGSRVNVRAPAAPVGQLPGPPGARTAPAAGAPASSVPATAPASRSPG